MSRRKVAAAAIALAIEKAKAGVDYSPRTGATCPWCGAERMRTVTTRPWEGDARVRFHLCSNPRCLLASLGQRVKSVEVDALAEGAA